jgi:predicted permease
MFIGFGANKIGWIPAEAGRYLSRIVLNIAAPCVVVSVMSSQKLAEGGLQSILLLLGIGAVQYIAVMALSFPLARLMRPPVEDRGIYRNFFTFTNNGFMGLPVTLAIFGHMGMFYMVILNCLFNIFIFTLGVWNVKRGVSYKNGVGAGAGAGAGAGSGDVADAGAGSRGGGAGGRGGGAGAASLVGMLKEVINPVIISLFIGFFLLLMQIQLPQPVTDVLDSVGAMMAPLSMMVIGLQLTESRIGEVIRNGRLIAMSLIRVVGLGAVCFAALAPFYQAGYIPSILVGILTLNLLLPCAAVPVMFADEYGGNTKIAAEGTFLSTLFSIITIPIAGVLLSML